MTAHHTPGPWYVGAQNDALYVIAGRAPSLNNDHPQHDAPRVAIARVFGPTNRDHIPVEANARLIAEAPEMERVLRRLEYWFDTDEDILAAMSEADRADNRRNLDMIRAILARIDGDVK